MNAVAMGRARSVAITGLQCYPIDIEVSVSDGLPTVDIVGLPDASVTESRKRIRSAIGYSGWSMPGRKVTVNLTPGDRKKMGTGFDLAIALAVLQAEGHVPSAGTAEVALLGELNLDGRLRPVRGVLPSLLAARSAGLRHAIVPHGNRDEAELIEGMRVQVAASLAHAAAICGAKVEPAEVEAVGAEPATGGPGPPPHDFAEVQGQAEARWAAEVAAAGGHHLLMVGTPGAGKTLLASCLPSILPDLDGEAAAETAAVRSIDGSFDAREGLSHRPPFENPHHKSTAAALLGSRHQHVGVLARANHGVLFLDEAPEFTRDVLEVLRQPLESGRLHVNRSWGTLAIDSAFQLVMAANPCPCGQAVGRGLRCRCTPLEKRRYLQKLSGPLLDRVDIQVEMMPVTLADLHARNESEPSAAIATRVRAARNIQGERYRSMPWRLNNRAPGAWLRETFDFSATETRPLDSALERGILTMRGYDRVFRIGTTIGDLAGRERPTGENLLAALLLRTREDA